MRTTSLDDVAHTRGPSPHAKLPQPLVYEQEYNFWPWGRLIHRTCAWVASNAPVHGLVLDYMCGTGYLLNELALLRRDLLLAGCDLTPSFVEYSKGTYPIIDVALCDALAYTPSQRPSIVICTGGLHHLRIEEQSSFLAKVARELLPGGWFVIGDELICNFQDEYERRHAVLEMATSLLAFIIDAKAPEDVLLAACDMLANDLVQRGEYKVSLQQLKEMLSPHFTVHETEQIWPTASSGFGDYLLYCQPR